METVIVTDSRRFSVNYHSHRTLSAERLDVEQIMRNEVFKLCPTKTDYLRLWVVGNNVKRIPTFNEKKLVAEIGRTLFEEMKITSALECEYVVEKYTQIKRKHVKYSGDSRKSKRNKEMNCSILRKPSAGKNLTSHLKGAEDGTEFSCEKLFSFTVHLSNQSDLNLIKRQPTPIEDAEGIVKSYTFHMPGYTLELSFAHESGRSLMDAIAEDAKENDNITHKLVLFFFFQMEDQIDYENKGKSAFVKNKTNLSIEALEQWKISEDAEGVTEKYENELQAIGREIQLEKLTFKKKLKAAENLIGESINIEKLLIDQNGNDTFISSVNIKSSANLGSKGVQGIQKSQSTEGEKIKYPGLLPSMNEFKKIRDISDAIRTIDSSIKDQVNAIATLKSTIKQTSLSRDAEAMIFAKQANQLRQIIQQVRDKVKQKQLQIKLKGQQGVFEELIALRNPAPTDKAHLVLNKLVKEFKSFDETVEKQEIVQNVKSIKCVVRAKVHQTVHHHPKFKDQENVLNKTQPQPTVESLSQEQSTTSKYLEQLKLVHEVYTANQRAIDQLTSKLISSNILEDFPHRKEQKAEKVRNIKQVALSGTSQLDFADLPFLESITQSKQESNVNRQNQLRKGQKPSK